MFDADIAAGIDTERPNVARMHDYYLGGKNNYPADRVAAAAVLEQIPEMVAGAHAGRAFLCRAVELLARRGIDQFLDLGCGHPRLGHDDLHQIAQLINRAARTVYVDDDPLVLSYARALLETPPQSRVLAGDVCRPGDILTAVHRDHLLDLSRPVAVLLATALPYVMADEQAAKIVAGYRNAVAPGSYLVISHPTADALTCPDAVKHVVAVYGNAGTPFTFRSRARVRALFDGLDVVYPGIIDVRQWPAGPADPTQGPTTVYGGVGYKQRGLASGLGRLREKARALWRRDHPEKIGAVCRSRPGPFQPAHADIVAEHVRGPTWSGRAEVSRADRGHGLPAWGVVIVDDAHRTVAWSRLHDDGAWRRRCGST